MIDTPSARLETPPRHYNNEDRAWVKKGVGNLGGFATEEVGACQENASVPTQSCAIDFRLFLYMRVTVSS